MNKKFESKDLIEEYTDMIYHIAMRYFDNNEDAKDIVQEVFLRYVSNIKAGKTFNDKEHEKCWIIRVTRNLCCNEINCARNRLTIPFKDCLYCEFKMDSENLIMEAIESLSDKYRIVFELYHLDGFKVSEISKVLNISSVNVRTRLKRAKDKVKEYLKKGEKV